MPEHSTDIHQLYSRILGYPQQNVEKAISSFVQEFETKRSSLAQDENTRVMLKDAPAQLENAKATLGTDLEGVRVKTSATLERLQLLQKSISDNSQNHEKTVTATQLAKEAFQKDISEAKDAFDQEMALRHADVVKQYVGAFVQQIDHY
ncbi:hypothetical protein BGZ76_002467 [Entomortierella beljakovae]|nr:hypothetical protein BGZ76_002467 [Entomortierella beljakovae]